MADHFSEYDAFNVPPEFRPLGTWAYVGLTILFSIPLIGLIFLIVFSFSDSNINRRNLARSYFCMFVVLAVLIAVAAVTGVLTETFAAVSDGRMPTYVSSLPWFS